MAELERRLHELGRELEYPPEPPLAARVTARLEAAPATARPRSARRTLVLIALAVLALGATAVAASRPVREALLDALGIGGVEIESTSAPPPIALERTLELGEPATIALARSELDFAPLVPRGLGPPDGVFIDYAVPGGEFSLTYPPSARLPATKTTGLGLLITEFRGDLAGEYAHKVLPEATRVHQLEIEGHRAAWISGAPHFFFYDREDDGYAERDLEVAENVLLLERGSVLVRLEGALSEVEAVRIARTLEPR